MNLDAKYRQPLDRLKRDKSVLIDALKDSGCDYMQGKAIRCPFCNDQKPSGSLYRTKSGFFHYKCHQCGFRGSVIDVLAKSLGTEGTSILRQLPREGGQQATGAANVRPTSMGPKVFRSLEAVESKLPGKVRASFEYRNLAGDVILVVFRCELPGGKTYRQASRCADGWVMRSLQKPWPLYNLPELVEVDTVFVVEGEKAAEALIVCGFCATTSLAGAGKSQYTDWAPLAGKKAILWPDHDTQGHRHMDEVQAVLLRLDCKVFRIDPEALQLGPKNDADDFLLRCLHAGLSSEQIATEFQTAIEGATPIRPSGSLKKILDDTIAGLRESVALPWPRLAELSHGLLPGTVLLVCGRPGAGKSFFLMQLLLYWLATEVSFAVYMLEEDLSYHLHRAMAMAAEQSCMFDPDWITANPKQVQAAYDQHAHTLDALAKRISAAPKDAPKHKDLLEWARVQAKAGTRIIAIDPVTAAQAEGDVWVNDQAFLAEFNRLLVEYRISGLLVTHPKKGHTVPCLDDLAGGAAYQRFSQTVFWLEAYPERKTAKIAGPCGKSEIQINRAVHICKARNGRGHGLRLGFNFDAESLLYAEQGLIVR